jgi:hypothetical protein
MPSAHRLVCELYGLTDEEIAIVESSARVAAVSASSPPRLARALDLMSQLFSPLRGRKNTWPPPPSEHSKISFFLLTDCSDLISFC